MFFLKNNNNQKTTYITKFIFYCFHYFLLSYSTTIHWQVKDHILYANEIITNKPFAMVIVGTPTIPG